MQQQERAIVVGDKPAANSLLRRLEQGQLEDPSKVLLYVPFTKSRSFTAIVLPTSSRVQQRSAALGSANTAGSSSIPRLQVKRGTDAAALARTLSFDLIKHGSVVVESSGAAATAQAAAALQAVRQQMLTRGYELGVVPRFEEQRITVLCQQVVLQELPVPRVTLPRNDWKPLDASAAAANTMLIKQRRLSRLSGVLAQVMQPRSAAAAAAAEGAQQQAPRGRGRAGKAQQEKRRLLLVWPPSTADQLLDSLEQLNQFAAAALVQEDSAAAAAGASAGAGDGDGDGLEAAAPAAEPAVSDLAPLLQLQLRRSRLAGIPSQQDAGLSGAALGADRKPAVATAESSVSGLAGAIEARVARAGAAWLWSDSSKQAHATAWQALLLASSKMDAGDGAGGLLALVDVQPQQQQQAQQPAAEQPNAAEQPQAEPQQQQQQQQQRGEGAQQRRRQPQQQQEQSYKLKMLIVRDSDVARSLLQSPNSPLEVSVTADLWPLLKFATAANTFLPVAASTGTGGLVMLPAVLPAAPAEPAPVAVDYRFDDAKQQLVPYAIRLQRFTGSLPQGMEVGEAQQLRVSLSTDPIKLRDAIVAKVLQQQPASVRFVGPVGRAPPLLTIAMAAVAAARVRLQQKGAPTDVGVMPYAETLLGPAAAGATAAEGQEGDGAAAAGGRKRKAAAGRQQGGAVQAGRVVYSLRLVPMPAAAAAAAAAAEPVGEQQAAAAAVGSSA
ncbi:hypothetical protein COO60DRAFT_1635331 [Scenedesmus sp. NREL 46B-D3]|nr:hypothetical protein COO60DRAFT_1635331 [Scenedesmus sp. NREL 46B-D3]